MFDAKGMMMFDANTGENDGTLNFREVSTLGVREKT